MVIWKRLWPSAKGCGGRRRCKLFGLITATKRNHNGFGLTCETRAVALDLYIDIRYISVRMIRNLVGKTTQDIYDGVNSRFSRKVPRELHDKARRLLDQINAAPSVGFLRIPPSNRLEKLKGGLSEYWSLRVNDQ